MNSFFRSGANFIKRQRTGVSSGKNFLNSNKFATFSTKVKAAPMIEVSEKESFCAIRNSSRKNNSNNLMKRNNRTLNPVSMSDLMNSLSTAGDDDDGV